MAVAAFATTTLGLTAVGAEAQPVSAAAKPAAATAAGGAFVSLNPVRIVGTATTGTTLAANASTTFTVPTTDVPAGSSAVALNVTAANPSLPGNLVAYPAGTSEPATSTTNFDAHVDVANSAVIPLPSTNQITVTNNSLGSTTLFVDLDGYFTSTTTGATTGAGHYYPLTPTRIDDTRTGSTYPDAGKTLSAGSTLNVQVTGKGNVPTSGVSGVVLNLTAVDITASSDYLTAFPTGQTPGTVSNLNISAGDTRAARVLVPVGSNGQVSFYNNLGTADIIVDVSGYFSDSTGSATGGSLFTPVTPPNRILDTRTGAAPKLSQTPEATQITGTTGIPTTTATGAPTAAVLNVTEADSQNNPASSYLTVYPAGGNAPSSSDLNYPANDARPNLDVATLSASGAIDAIVGTGTADVIYDSTGYFAPAASATANVVQVTANPTTIPADGATTTTITATVTNPSGGRIGSDAVAFTLSGASCTSSNLTPLTGVTNANGQVTATLTASSTAGSCTVTATEANGAASGSTTVTESVTTQVAVTATPPAIQANGTSTSVVSATVTNASGAASGDKVTFTVSGSGCGTVSPASATTSTTGVATTTYTSSSTAGQCVVTATEATTGQSDFATVTQTTQAPNAAATLTASPATTSVNVGATDKITYTATDASGNPVANDPVYFEYTPDTTSGSTDSCGTIPTPVTTGSSGTVTVTYTASSVAGDCTIVATEGTYGAQATTNLTQNPGAATKVSASPTTIPADSVSTSTITATVKDANGNPETSDAVAFTVSSGCGQVSPTSATTNSSGVATTTYTAGSQSGFCTVTATPTTGAAGTVTIDQTVSTGKASIVVNPSTASVPASTSSSQTLTATVTGANGAPASGDAVAATVSPSTCGTIATSPTSTNGSGQAVFAYTASTTAGTCTVTFTEAANGQTATATITQTNNTTVAFTPNVITDTTVGGAAQPVMVTVSKPSGPVSGDTVTLATSGTCGTLVSPTATTSSSGVATFSYTPSNTAGFCTLTATESGSGATATGYVDQETNPASTGYVIQTITANPTSIPADGASTSKVIATVVNGSGAPVTGDQVAFFPEGTGCGTVSPFTAVTNGSGQAQVTYTASTTVNPSCAVYAQEADNASVSDVGITQTAPTVTLVAGASPTALPAGGGSSTITVTATASSKPASGQTITLSGSAGCGTISPTSATTGSNGQITATYTSTATQNGGTCTITATDGTANTTVSVSQSG